MSSRKAKYLQFNTAIITYPSNYDNLLTIQLIEEKFKSICQPSTKVVIAQEDPDEEIQRVHYHVYFDDDECRKQISQKYFDIPLPEPVVVFINPDTTRSYQLYSELSSILGIDANDEMASKIDPYVEEHYEIGTTWDILKVAHPNIQLKKQYGDKYFMLKYVVKQKLVKTTMFVTNFDYEKELKYLEDNCEELNEKCNEIIKQNFLRQLNLKTIDELIVLLKKYKLKKLRKEAKGKGGDGSGRRLRKNERDLDDNARAFRDWLRPLVIESKLTKKEVMNEITENPIWWDVFSSNYINYNKLINDMFRGRPPTKPSRHYEFTFWVPNKLYDYLVWLDDWVMKWNTGKPLEHRPKGLCLIGPSRTGKTSLFSLLGEFSYFKNIWSLDCWEGKAAFTVMDDMDAGDEGKGLSFCWYKPFFGAQDAITVTDKFKPKEDIYNGKPLIWLNNYDICETFKSDTAQDYIRRNMEIVYISRPFTVEPTGMDVYCYKKFDPKTTWYYQNIYLPKELERKEEEEKLSLRKQRIQQHQLKEKEKGRLAKRIRTEDNIDQRSSVPSGSED